MARRTSPALSLLSAARLPRSLDRPSRWLSSSVTDFASLADVKAGAFTNRRNVLLAQRPVEFKPFVPKAQRLRVESSQLFASSNDPLLHGPHDVGRYFQLDSSTTVFQDVFFHHGMLGEHVQKVATRLQNNAIMVREAGLELRDELLGLQREGNLAKASALIVDGIRGSGKSSLLNYAISCCHQAGWLVVTIPYAADWTLGLSARTVQWPNEAYRLTNAKHFKQLPPGLANTELYEAPDASYNFLLAHALSQGDKFAQIKIKDPERASFYSEHAADKKEPTIADLLSYVLEDKSDRCALAHYRVQLLKSPGTALYLHRVIQSLWFPSYHPCETTETASQIQSLYLDLNRPCETRLDSTAYSEFKMTFAMHNSARCSSIARPRLCGRLHIALSKTAKTAPIRSFEEFPIAARPVYDFLEELKMATELPVLLVVDGWNRFHQMASSTQWDSAVPLHGQQLLVPHLLGNLEGYGGQMANGVMLCAVTRGDARPHRVPKRLRKFIPPPFDFSNPSSLPEAMRKAIRKVGPFSAMETQRTLEYYALAGHMQNTGLEDQLRTGELQCKVRLMTGGVGADIFKLCEQM